MKFSFIIPSYNSHLTLARTIESIDLQSRRDLISEIVLVDSSEDEKTRALLDTFECKDLKILRQSQKTPPARGRNIGAGSSTGDVFCFIDSDVYLDREWLQGVHDAVIKGRQAGCGAIALPPFQNGNQLATAQLYLQFNEYLDTVSFHERLFVPSCNLFCERALFEKVGGFPDLRASEDTMFCLSLKNLAKIWFVPEAKCFHVFREEWGSFKRNQQLLGKYVIIYRREYYRKWYYRGVFAVVLLPVFLMIKMTWICRRVYNAGAVHRKAFLSSFGFFILGLMHWSWGFIQGCFCHDDLGS